jgi:uncharacterized integral membrane protein
VECIIVCASFYVILATGPREPDRYGNQTSADPRPATATYVIVFTAIPLLGILVIMIMRSVKQRKLVTYAGPFVLQAIKRNWPIIFVLLSGLVFQILIMQLSVILLL